MSKAGASSRVRAPGSMDPVTYGKATRQIIFEKSINPGWAPYNQHIRRALGFREKNAGGKGRPVFASENVNQLYGELDDMAKKLPNHSQQELKRAWEKQTYTKDVRRLVDNYGEKIWGDSLKDRELSSNPKSQLLTAEDGSEAGNLFYQYERHRKFITLQLEHLLFMKAIAVYHNYHGPSAPRSAAESRPVSTRSTRPGASKPRKRSSSVARYIFTFRLPSDKMRAVLCRTSKRIAEKKRARDAAGRLLYEVTGESDNEWTPTKRRRPSQRYPRLSASDVTDDDSSASEQSVEGDESSTAGRNGSDGALIVGPVSEEVKRSMRMDMAVSLYSEFCHEDDGSHNKLPDANSMLVASKRLDNVIHTLRRQDEDKLRKSLGGSFQQDLRTLDAWLSWREGCWLLSEATGIHPFGGQPTPRFTVGQWNNMFGGGEKCRRIHQTLLKCGQIALGIHDGKDEKTLSTASSLARVFAAMAESPMLEQSLPNHIVAHNKLLSSWKMDFWL
ncbi:hypothetical protein DPSP01_002914 [Paraphaeosphaeria sporulosa]